MDTADEITRLLFLPSDPNSFQLKHADIEGYQSQAGKWVDPRWEVDEDESVETVKVLAVAQSVYSVV